MDKTRQVLNIHADDSQDELQIGQLGCDSLSVLQARGIAFISFDSCASSVGELRCSVQQA